jgi:hypothetical protein
VAFFLGEVEDEFGEVRRVERRYERDKFRPLARGSECARIIEDFAGSDVFRHCTALRWCGSRHAGLRTSGTYVRGWEGSITGC